MAQPKHTILFSILALEIHFPLSKCSAALQNWQPQNLKKHAIEEGGNEFGSTGIGEKQASSPTIFNDTFFASHSPHFTISSACGLGSASTL
jgi:hypothetical protein